LDVREAFEGLKKVLRAWDAKLVEGEAKVCVPKELPEPVAAEDPLVAAKELIERSEDFWSAYECEEVPVSVAYDGRRLVYDPEAEPDLKLLIAALYEHYLNHKSEWSLRRSWREPYIYVLMKIYGRSKAFEALKASFKSSDVYDGAALRAHSRSSEPDRFELLLNPSAKARVQLGKDVELDESLDKLILQRPELEKKMFAYALLSDAPKFLGFELGL